VHIGEVLVRHLGHRDVEDVEVLLADQVEQQVQRALEGIQQHLERIRGDIEIVGDAAQRLAMDARDDRQLELLLVPAGVHLRLACLEADDRTCQMACRSGRCPSVLGLVGVRLLRHARLQLLAAALQVERRTVPPDGAAAALLGFQAGALRFQLLEEQGQIGFVGHGAVATCRLDGIVVDGQPIAGSARRKSDSDMGRTGTRPERWTPRAVARLAAAASVAFALAATTAGCDYFAEKKLVVGQHTEQDVRQLMGVPDLVWEEENGAKKLEYPRGPMGTQTYFVHIGPDGRYLGMERALVDSNFAKVKVGMSQD